MITGSQKRKEVDGLERLEKGALQHTHRLLLWLLLITLLAAPLLLPATSAQVTQTVILTDTNAEKQTRIEALQTEVEALKARLAASEPHNIAGQE